MAEEKALQATIRIGDLEVSGYQLPNGEYLFSQAAAGEAVGKPRNSALRFLSSNAAKAFLGEDLARYTPESIELELGDGQRGSTRFNAIPLELVTAYWVHQCSLGNKAAIALVMALSIESLERRFDTAFDVETSDSERNERLSQRLVQLERGMGEAYALEDDLRRENRELWQYLQDEGLPGPYQLPGEEPS
ncbi:MAG: hypothetical protein HC771_14405 [Synechococcales cyanobacterium CRU_2_2]|nr:hypothetical protein [Synechococcales cyanobacterium CRU_2_2]